jgi:type II secretory pathway pseudopilin PulG
MAAAGLASVRNARAASGFSLVETLVAASLLATALVALAELMAVAVRTGATARDVTMATTLAQQKLEQLRGLAWGFDALGLPASDVTTDTAVSPERPRGGTGLSPSPAGALQRNTSGYVDYLDAAGRSLGGGDVPPTGTMYARRWSIAPLAASPDTLVLQVLVTRRLDGGTGGPTGRRAEDARLLGVRTRMLP